MPELDLFIETECLAAVPMRDGTKMCLLKFNEESITTRLQPSRGHLGRGKFYRVTFEEIPRIEGSRS